MKKAGKKNFVILICAGIISVSMLFAGCTVREDRAGDGQNDSADSRESDSAATGQAASSGEELEEAELEAEELSWFTDFVNQRENNGFLLSDYENPQDVNLGEVLYNGAGIESESLSEAEQKAYEAAGHTVETDITRLTTAQIEDFLQRKMGIGMKDVTGGLDWVYLDEFDCYVFQHGDTNFSFFTCDSGRRVGENIYELHCSAESEYIEDCVLTLRKTGEEYQILSNLFDSRRQ